MRRMWSAAAAIVAVSVTLGAMRRAGPRPTTTDVSLPIYSAALARLDRALARLDGALATGDPGQMRRAFREARSTYKHVELFAEYYASSRVRELNGVPMPKAEDEDPETPLEPIGLQMVESMLFPDVDTVRRSEARELVGYMRTTVRALARRGADSMPGDAYLFDAMKQEVARVSTLGIAGFDATLSGDAMTESADALTGVREAFAPYRGPLSRRDRLALLRFDAAMADAIAYLRANADFDAFDRLTFLADHAIPLARALTAAQRSLGIGAPPRPRAFAAAAGSIFDDGAIDPQFFAATDAPRPTLAIVSLGRELFFEPALSPSGSRSCATCHLPERAFTDGRARPLLLGHRAPLRARNTPTLINAGLQPTLFADGRVRTLEDQATDVMGSPSEMGGSLAQAAETLSRRPEYRARFGAAFGVSPEHAVTPRTLRIAVAAYVRSLTRLNAPFDRAVRGDSTARTAEERDGFNLFMGKAKCGTCHFAPLFGGAMPPALTENEPEVIGVPERRGARHPVVDPDSGRFNVRRIDQHLHAFKTPSLRNVALTAPYMHNGAFPTLESVVDFYDAGGGVGIGATVSHQTLPADSLHLSARQKRAIVAFMRSLTDTAGTTARSVR